MSPFKIYISWKDDNLNVLDCTKFLCLLVFLLYLYILLFNTALGQKPEKHFDAYKSTLYKYVLK